MGSLLWRRWPIFRAPHHSIRRLPFTAKPSRRQRAARIGFMLGRILSQIAHDVVIITLALAYSDYERGTVRREGSTTTDRHSFRDESQNRDLFPFDRQPTLKAN